MRTIILSALMALATNAFAQTEYFEADKVVAKSSATIRIVSVSSSVFTLVDTSTSVPANYSQFVVLPGSDYELLQSTDATAGFCCSFEVDATTSVASGAKGCVQAEKEPGGNFYKLELRRWWQNLRTYCMTNKTTGPTSLRVYQHK